jgi:hypothetical protein
MTLFLHEVHRVVGRAEDEFEAAFRDRGGWMDLLGRGDDARLLAFWHHAHGSGPSYQVVTITALADGAAWERLARRVHEGDLTGWAERVDGLRHDVVAKLLIPCPWSPVDQLDLAMVPTTAIDREVPLLWMEDTVWPEKGRLGEYLGVAGGHYVPLLDRPASLLVLHAALVGATGSQPEVVLLQAARDPGRIVQLLMTEIGPELRPPGTWMHDALEYRDQWRSRLLRLARWSPWPAS